MIVLTHPGGELQLGSFDAMILCREVARLAGNKFPLLNGLANSDGEELDDAGWSQLQLQAKTFTTTYPDAPQGVQRLMSTITGESDEHH